MMLLILAPKISEKSDFSVGIGNLSSLIAHYGWSFEYYGPIFWEKCTLMIVDEIIFHFSWSLEYITIPG